MKSFQNKYYQEIHNEKLVMNTLQKYATNILELKN